MGSLWFNTEKGNMFKRTLFLSIVFLSASLLAQIDPKPNPIGPTRIPIRPPWPEKCQQSCKIFETYIIVTRYLFRHLGCSIKDVICFPDNKDPYDPTNSKDTHYKDQPYLANEETYTLEQVEAYLEEQSKSNISPRTKDAL